MVDQTEAKLKDLSITKGENQSKTVTLPVSKDMPVVLIVMGMAGSGKTTFVHVSTLACNTLVLFVLLTNFVVFV